jgi:hypothetical protein
MWHWFVLPVLTCGLMTGVDGVRWITGEYELYDPRGAAGALCWYQLFLAPLLFVRFREGLLSVAEEPADWRPWVGCMSLLSCIGWGLYVWGNRIGRRRSGALRRVWRVVSWRAALPGLVVSMAVALACQAYFWVATGGIAGWLEQLSIVRETGHNPWTGLAMFQAMGSALPLFVLIAMTLARNRRRDASLGAVMGLLGILGAAQFAIGGWESRTATVWSMVWFAGIVTHWWRPISRLAALTALVGLAGFMYGYGLYKGGGGMGGLDVLEVLASGRLSLRHVELDTQRTLSRVLINDLSRIDVQSYEVYRLATYQEYELRWGTTYVSDVISFVPSWIWHAKPLDPEKVAAGTDLTRGCGVYRPGERFGNAMFVYGPAGEAMLNFGILAAPIPFCLIGLAMGCYRRRVGELAHDDARHFITPLGTIVFLMALSHDLDNTLAIVIFKGLPVAALLWLCARRLPRSAD